MRVNTTPDKEYEKEIRRKIKDNGGYCPCRINKTKETKCMCAEFRSQIDRGEPGYCHCGLYYIAE